MIKQFRLDDDTVIYLSEGDPFIEKDKELLIIDAYAVEDFAKALQQLLPPKKARKR